MKEFSLSTGWWQLVLIAVVCYLIGCFNFARFISKIKHRDITKMGSGNPGTMNMSREFGWKIGVLTFFCDAFKGGIPALVAFFVFKGYVFAGTVVRMGDFIRYFCGVCVIVGHIFPVQMHFKGGKGIASTLGLFWINLACENPWFLLLGFLFLVFIAYYIYATEWGSMGSLIGVTGFAIWQGVIFYLRYAELGANPYVISLYAILLFNAILTWGAHHKNIMRLLAGEEHHTSVKKMIKKKKS